MGRWKKTAISMKKSRVSYTFTNPMDHRQPLRGGASIYISRKQVLISQYFSTELNGREQIYNIKVMKNIFILR